MHMLHHISLPVSDIKRSSQFYEAILKPLGYKKVIDVENFIGYGQERNKDKFSIVQKEKIIQIPSTGFHIAFAAPNQDAIDLFHHNALTHGGICNGKPGLRPHYGPNYYAAFVKDPDGYHIEAVINE